MLPGEDQRRLQSLRAQRPGKWLKFDGFRPGADDEPYVCGKQLSP
jgi:hypothetical protein